MHYVFEHKIGANKRLTKFLGQFGRSNFTHSFEQIAAAAVDFADHPTFKLCEQSLPQEDDKMNRKNFLL